MAQSPRIAVYEQRTQTPTGTAGVGPRAGGLAFSEPGPGVAPGLAELADSTRRLGLAFAQQSEDNTRAWTANAVSQARLEWTQNLLARQEKAEPGAPEFAASFLSDFDDYISKMVDTAPNDRSKAYLRERLYDLRTNLGERAMVYEATARVDYRDDQHRSAVDNSAKLMNTDPSQYAVVMAETLAAIDASAMPAVKKSQRREYALNTISKAAVWSQIQRSPQQFLNSIGFGVIQNPDGTISTERTITIEADGKHYVIPTIVNGQQLTENQAISAWRQGANAAVGTFDDAESANRFARDRSVAGGKMSRSSGDLTGRTGNQAFDALPFEQRVAMFDAAIRSRNQVNIDADRATQARQKRLADDAMKDAWDKFYSGKLRLQDVQLIKPLITDNDYKSLREALRRGVGEGGGKDDQPTFRRLQSLLYTNPRKAHEEAFVAHQNGLIRNDTLSSVLARARELDRTGGPKTQYERSRSHIINSLDPGPMMPDPVGKSRYAEALDTFDTWMNQGKRTDAEIDARAKEIVDQYRLISFGDTVMALPNPRGTQIRRNIGDINGIRQDIFTAQQKLQKDRDTGRLSPEEYAQEMRTLDRWRKAIETQQAKTPANGKR